MKLNELLKLVEDQGERRASGGWHPTQDGFESTEVELHHERQVTGQRNICPRCKKPISHHQLIYEPSRWRGQCPSCETKLTVNKHELKVGMHSLNDAHDQYLGSGHR